jgi:hypothetical protein
MFLAFVFNIYIFFVLMMENGACGHGSIVGNQQGSSTIG